MAKPIASMNIHNNSNKNTSDINNPIIIEEKDLEIGSLNSIHHHIDSDEEGTELVPLTSSFRNNIHNNNNINNNNNNNNEDKSKTVTIDEKSSQQNINSNLVTKSDHNNWLNANERPISMRKRSL